MSIKLGSIAANLARTSSFLENTANLKTVLSILEESKYLIEWTIVDAPFKTQILLSEIQPILALWQRMLSRDLSIENIDAIREKAGLWSLQLLELSGLLYAK